MNTGNTFIASFHIRVLLSQINVLYFMRVKMIAESRIRFWTSQGAIRVPSHAGFTSVKSDLECSAAETVLCRIAALSDAGSPSHAASHLLPPHHDLFDGASRH